jgi:hypothetical protein
MDDVQGAKARAIGDALARIGEPITENEAKRVAAAQDCECKDGMFALAANRRQISPVPGSSQRPA